jgi:hypothetical protein
VGAGEAGEKGEIKMQRTYRTLAAIFGALALALVFAPNSSAQCGALRTLTPTPASLRYHLAAPRLLQAAFLKVKDDEDDAGIVGFWHVKFVSKGSAGIPDGAEVDAGYAQWHSDGTEIMNSAGRSPISGSFCLGVWKQTGERNYKLNHFAAAWDPTGSFLIGPTNIQETVTLDPDKDSFAGTFTIDVYNETGTSLAHLQGTITGTRINVNTPQSSIF